jgi:hypothetical protein
VVVGVGNPTDATATVLGRETIHFGDQYPGDAL